jgi:hypothetical protein
VALGGEGDPVEVAAQRQRCGAAGLQVQRQALRLLRTSAGLQQRLTQGGEIALQRPWRPWPRRPVPPGCGAGGPRRARSVWCRTRGTPLSSRPAAGRRRCVRRAGPPPAASGRFPPPAVTARQRLARRRSRAGVGQDRIAPTLPALPLRRVGCRCVEWRQWLQSAARLLLRSRRLQPKAAPAPSRGRGPGTG